MGGGGGGLPHTYNTGLQIRPTKTSERSVFGQVRRLIPKLSTDSYCRARPKLS